MPEKLLQQIFKKVYGKPSWRVQKSDGSTISFEFGKPKLKVSEKVIQPNPKTGRKYPKRRVTIYGDWNLWVFDCDWEIRQGDSKICDSNSQAEKISQGCTILDGQMLNEVVVHPKTLTTDFYFDLGGHLKTKPCKNEDEPSSMWDLFCPNKRVFSLRSDGNYSYQDGETPGNKLRWLPFTF